MTMDRRKLLRLGVLSGAIGISGCIGQNKDASQDDEETSNRDKGDDQSSESASEELSDGNATDEEASENTTSEDSADEDPTEETPTLKDVSVETTDVTEGTELQLTVRAESTITVNWLHIGLDGPNGSIRGGGQEWDFQEVDDNVWETEWTYTVSENSENGEYYFSRIHVKNEANLESEPWHAELGTPIQTEADPDKPVLRDVSLETVDVHDGTELQLSVIAESNIPVDWLHISLDGPNGSIRGGGQGWDFTERGADTWETEWTYTISDEAASGEYYFSRIRVENEADLESDPWPKELGKTIETEVEPEEPTLTEVTVETADVTEGTELQLSVRAESTITVNWLHVSLDGPNGSLRGGGQGWEFTEVDEDQWETEWTYTISDEAPSGEYYFTRIHVENEANLESKPWPDEPSATIEND